MGSLGVVQKVVDRSVLEPCLGLGCQECHGGGCVDNINLGTNLPEFAGGCFCSLMNPMICE